MIPLGVLAGSRHVAASGGNVPVWEGVLNTVYVTSPDQTPLVVPASGTPGRLLVSAIAVDKNAGSFEVSPGWIIAAQYTGTSVSAALAWRIATGSDDITWTTSSSHIAISSVHEWSGFSSSPVISTSVYPDPPDNINRTTLTASVNSGGLAVALVTWDTGASATPSATSFTNDFTVLQNQGFVLTGYGPAPLVLAGRNFPAGAVAETTAVIPTTDQSTLLLAVFA